MDNVEKLFERVFAAIILGILTVIAIALLPLAAIGIIVAYIMQGVDFLMEKIEERERKAAK